MEIGTVINNTDQEILNLPCSKPAATKTKFHDPYKADGKTNKEALGLNTSVAQSGVYFIKDKATNKVIYIGYSGSSLYKTVYRHFQTWSDHPRCNRPRITYPKTGYTVRIIHTTKHRAWLLEKYLVMKAQPRDNKHKYDKYLKDRQIKVIEEQVKEIRDVQEVKTT